MTFLLFQISPCLFNLQVVVDQLTFFINRRTSPSPSSRCHQLRSSTDSHLHEKAHLCQASRVVINQLGFSSTNFRLHRSTSTVVDQLCFASTNFDHRRLPTQINDIIMDVPQDSSPSRQNADEITPTDPECVKVTVKGITAKFLLNRPADELIPLRYLKKGIKTGQSISISLLLFTQTVRIGTISQRQMLTTNILL